MSDDLPAIAPEFPPKSQFHAWLRSLPADEVVAENWSCTTCPLAMWLGRTGIAEYPYISPGLKNDAVWTAGASTQPRSLTALPGWANKFGNAIDRFRRPVTASDCLCVLAGTPRG